MKSRIIVMLLIHIIIISSCVTTKETTAIDLVKQKNWRQLSKFLDENDTNDNEKYKILVNAIAFDKFHIYKKIIQSGYNVNFIPDEIDSSIMHWSLSTPKDKYLEFALINGGDPNLGLNIKETMPLISEAIMGELDNTNKIQLLIKYGADYEMFDQAYSPIFFSMGLRKFYYLYIFLEKGINFEPEVKNRFINWFSELYYSVRIPAQRKDLEKVSLLLKQKYEIYIE